MSTPATVLVDGRPATAIDVRDRGLHYGDGLFETVLVRGGRARFAAMHEARLARSLVRLGFPPTPSPDLQTLADQLGTDGVLKLIVTRGDARARGYGTTDDETPRQIALWYPGAAAPLASPCVATVLRDARWGENPALAGLKHLNRLEQVLARRELARTPGVDEGLVRSVAGPVVSGTQSNLFLVRGSLLITPPVDRCGIAGVLREVVLREAAHAGFSVVVAPIAVEALAPDDGLFVTNARVGVWPVTRLDARQLPVSDAVEQLASHVQTIDA